MYWHVIGTRTRAYVLAAMLASSAGVAAVYGIDRPADNASGRLLGPGSLLISAARAETAPADGISAYVAKSPPAEMPEIAFVDGDGKPRTLKDWRGKVVLLNIWATWCAPCRKEMPSLDKLQKELGSDRFEVVALAVDRTGVDAARKFLGQVQTTSLKLYVDPTARMAAPLQVTGMPTTLLIDREGRELGRLVGPAEWDSPAAKALIEKALQ